MLYEHITRNVKLSKSFLTKEEDVRLPNGKVVRMGVVLFGPEQGLARNINVSILDNNNEIVKPLDYRFAEKTAGGNFLDGFMPVDFEGSKNYQARLTTTEVDNVNDVTAQFIFIVEKPNQY